MIVLWLGVEIACCVFLIKVARWVMREWRRHRDVILARSLPVPDVNPLAAQVLADAAEGCGCGGCTRARLLGERILAERAAEIAALESAFEAPAYLRSQP